jgi:hypothetical protein
MLIYKIGMHGKSSVMYDHGVDQCFLSLAASNVTCQEFVRIILANALTLHILLELKHNMHDVMLSW